MTLMSVTVLSIPIVICPGFHDSSWTDAFLQSITFTDPGSVWVFPTAQHPACSGVHIFNFLYDLASKAAERQDSQGIQRVYALEMTPVLIGFSAGVVGMVQAAWVWQQLGGKISAMLAVDGWGVPLINDCPCYRLSHDFFTHWSSALLGGGDRFYASPSVTHSELWQHPQQVKGWWTHEQDGKTELRTPTTAAAFIEAIIIRHGVMPL
jgi:hypothetical protein